MNDSLAVSLLAKVTKWEDKRLSKELPKLSFMARTKYDSYSQFDPGFRFMSSFAQWMSQFDKEDVETIYSAFNKYLTFISPEQIKYLVDLMYSSKIKPFIRDLSASRAGLSRYQLIKIENSQEYKIQKRLSLVVGLSDGSHIDILRRTAGFSNEQVLPMYYPNQEKLQDMYDELHKDRLLKGTNRNLFESLFLVDDFTASGTSFARKEDKFKGKIIKILRGLKPSEAGSEGKGADESKELSDLFVKDKIKVNALFCVATEEAIKNIKKEVDSFLKDNGMNDLIQFNVDCVQLIKTEEINLIKNHPGLKNVLKKDKYYDWPTILTDSYRKGKHDEPYWGFNECGLLLVLSHNTPNNTMPVIWEDTNKFRGLFPRISRH
ncbi:MAG: hypothetical protein IJR04_02135 [Bacteroidales bacterium]|nr:hypothetical protein [Bacteroidales bacterium]